MMFAFPFRLVPTALARLVSFPLLLVGLLTGINPTAITDVQTQASQPLVIVVRDGAGRWHCWLDD